LSLFFFSPFLSAAQCFLLFLLLLSLRFLLLRRDLVGDCDTKDDEGCPFPLYLSFRSFFSSPRQSLPPVKPAHWPVELVWLSSRRRFYDPHTFVSFRRERSRMRGARREHFLCELSSFLSMSPPEGIFCPPNNGYQFDDISWIIYLFSFRLRGGVDVETQIRLYYVRNVTVIGAVGSSSRTSWDLLQYSSLLEISFFSK